MPFAQMLENALGEVEELLDVWVTCQNQAQLFRSSLVALYYYDFWQYL